MMSHTHSHDHKYDAGHAHEPGHSHADLASADGRRRVALAGLLTAGFMIVEVIGGIVSGSLALLADAAHMLTDAASLGLAWVGYRLATRPADETRSYGFTRMRILAAFTNGIALMALAAWITVEAVQRLFAQSEIIAPLLLGVAVLGLVVNLVAFAILHGGDREDLNLKGAMWHVAGDMLGSVAAITAALVILQTGWLAIDPLLSLFVAGLVAVAGWRIARDAGHILVEGAPAGLTPEAIRAALLASVPELAAVSHVHAWSLTEKQPLVTLEAVGQPGACPHKLREAVKAALAASFGVTHATVEVREAETAPAG